MARMPAYRFVTLSCLALAVSIGTARADEPFALPTFARNPQLDGQTKSPWTGFTFGSEIMAISSKGAKGRVGGDAFIGYSQAFDNHLVLGMTASAGYMPSFATRGPSRGFDFAMTNVKLGYDMGRVQPYVTAGIGLARPTSGFGTGMPNAGDSLNNLFGGGSGTRALTSVGAGVDFAVTEHLTVGVGVTAMQGRGVLVPSP
ncbi:MAG: Outer rane immunogenic protein [Hyphomicrobiales bacterium]|jgi:opacity protein-like surface antigen|nr:Outer rane immunogenic protein [Hyphomicrobiales bacterium]